MFDFENTPITKYTRLQAQWDCPIAGPTYDGDWARVTLVDGTVLECQSQSEFNSLMVSSGSSIISGVNVPAANVTGVEFGTKVVYLDHNALRTVFFTKLQSLSGFHEGLTTIGNYFLYGNNRNTTTPLMEGILTLPSTLTRIGSYFMDSANTFVGTVVFESNPTIDGAHFMTSKPSSAPSYTQGVKIMGAYANEILTKFPNSNTAGQYRNLYNGNTGS